MLRTLSATEQLSARVLPLGFGSEQPACWVACAQNRRAIRAT